MSDHLSGELLTYADQLDNDVPEDLTPAEREEWWEYRAKVKKIVSLIVTSREKISTADLRIIEDLLDAIPDALGELAG